MVKAPAVRGKIHSTPPAPRFKQIPQHFFPESVTPVSKKPFEAESPSRKIYEARGLIVPRTRPCNSPTLLVRKPKGHGWRLVRDSERRSTPFPPHPIVPVPHPLLASHILYCNDLCRACFFLFLVFLGPHLQHMEVLRFGV